MSLLHRYKNSTRPKLENGIKRYSNAVKRNISGQAITHNWTGTWSNSIGVFQESEDVTIIGPTVSRLRQHPLAPTKANNGDYTEFIISRSRAVINGYKISPRGMKQSPLEVARMTGKIKDYL